MSRRSSTVPRSRATAQPPASSAAAAQTPRNSQQQGTAAVSGDCVHLLLCTNSAFLQHAAVCLLSLLVNNPALFFDIALVRRVDEELDEDKLRRSLAPFPNHSLRFESFAPPPGITLLTNGFYTIETWARLWVGDFFPPGVDRVLYLDSDIIVVGSIAPLWGVDLDAALLGAVDIPGSQAAGRLGIPAEEGYFNAGVLLIDLKQWRETRALQTVLDFVAAHPERIRTVDQDALNACFYSRRKRLDYKWNVIRPFFREPLALPLPRAEIETVRREARIIHFNGASKPWSYFCDHPRKAEYDKYLRMTEWRDFVPQDRTPFNRLRKAASALLPQPVKGVLKGIGARATNSRGSVGRA